MDGAHRAVVLLERRNVARGDQALQQQQRCPQLEVGGVHLAPRAGAASRHGRPVVVGHGHEGRDVAERVLQASVEGGQVVHREPPGGGEPAPKVQVGIAPGDAEAEDGLEDVARGARVRKGP